MRGSSLILTLALALGLAAGCGHDTPTPTPTPTPEACAAGTPVAGTPALTTTLVASGFEIPLDLQAPPGDRDRVFVVEQVGAIKIVNVISRIIGDTAILSYDANETETIFGQNLRARYHITDTWLRRNGQWQLIASQAHRYYEDPAISKADGKKFPDFVGSYELAPGQTRTVTSENGKLFIERNGKKEELFPETSDLFFRKGVEGRILFRYDSTGKVDALIDRRNNEDVIWRKIK